MARSELHGSYDSHRQPDFRLDRCITIDGGSGTTEQNQRLTRQPHPRSQSLPYLMTAASGSDSKDIESTQPTSHGKKGLGKPVTLVKSWQAVLCGKAAVKWAR